MIKPDTQIYRFLELVGISGEFPYAYVDKLEGGKEYKKKIIYFLTEQGFIKKFAGSRLSGYRLTAKGKQFLLDSNPSRFTFYLTGSVETNMIRTEPSRRIRLHKQAETNVIMQQSGVEIFRDQKPSLLLPQASNENSHFSCVYYGSREIKESGVDAVKIKGSRAMGVLISPARAYIVYNTSGNLMQWNSRSESKMKAYISQLLHDRHLYGDVYSIVIGTNEDLALQILNSTGGNKRSSLIVDIDVYDHIYYVPDTNNRSLCMTFLTQPDFAEQLKDDIIAAFEMNPAASDSFLQHDAITRAGLPVLISCDFDLARVVRFYTALQLRRRKGVVICFDFQAQVFSEYFAGISEIMAIASDSILGGEEC